MEMDTKRSICPWITLVCFLGIFSFSTNARADFPVIDVHTHLSFSGKKEVTSGISVTREQFELEAKQAGLVGAVALGHNGVYSFDKPFDKPLVIRCYGIREKFNAKDLEAKLKSKDARCIKVYLGYVHRYAYDKAYWPVYRLAEKYDVPVVFHTGDTYSTKGKLRYAHPLTVDDVAVDFPKVTFVIAHMGNPWIETAAEVAYKNPNVYVEASALLIGDLQKKDTATFLEKPIRWSIGYMEGVDKLMFGTDWPLVSIPAYLEAYKRAIPKEHWCQVFFENAVKVFRLHELKDVKCDGGKEMGSR
jgi:uncharacterized protein